MTHADHARAWGRSRDRQEPAPDLPDDRCLEDKAKDYPDFEIGRGLIGRRYRYIALRRQPLLPGLHTLITDDEAEFFGELARFATGEYF